MGIGISRKVKLKEVEIINDISGKPHVVLTGNAGLFAIQNKITRVEISLSWVKDYAVAFAVAFQA